MVCLQPIGWEFAKEKVENVGEGVPESGRKETGAGPRTEVAHWKWPSHLSSQRKIRKLKHGTGQRCLSGHQNWDLSPGHCDSSIPAGLGEHGGHSIQSISGDWASLGKEGGPFGTYGSKRRERKEKVLGLIEGGSVVMASL